MSKRAAQISSDEDDETSFRDGRECDPKRVGITNLNFTKELTCYDNDGTEVSSENNLDSFKFVPGDHNKIPAELLNFVATISDKEWTNIFEDYKGREYTAAMIDLQFKYGNALKGHNILSSLVFQVLFFLNAHKEKAADVLKKFKHRLLNSQRVARPETYQLKFDNPTDDISSVQFDRAQTKIKSVVSAFTKLMEIFQNISSADYVNFLDKLPSESIKNKDIGKPSSVVRYARIKLDNQFITYPCLQKQGSYNYFKADVDTTNAILEKIYSHMPEAKQRALYQTLTIAFRVPYNTYNFFAPYNKIKDGTNTSSEPIGETTDKTFVVLDNIQLNIDIKGVFGLKSFAPHAMLLDYKSSSNNNYQEYLDITENNI